MEKAYSPESFESRVYKAWMDGGYFAAQDVSSKPPFSIMMPPPNVTGVLHNGHALFVTIQDALTRWKRMQGFNALWLPGTDHAGISTQMVVERDLSKQGVKRHDLGREKFIAKVWEWKEKHGEIIYEQMRKLGASADWSRARFTMDEGLSKAVREVFVTLYEQGLMYRGTRLINWCSRCVTALSDLEVVPKDTKGAFYHIKYGPLVVATTRPETLLGDVAVAVHPEDERFKNYIGTKVKLPLTNREIPVIGDTYVDREFGTGALKITPGHDFNDFDVGARHKLGVISIFDAHGKVNENGGVYKGLNVAEARDKVVADLTEQGLLVKTEEHAHSVGTCQRCERVVEPRISDQWFLNVKPMAEKALEAARKGEKLSFAEVDKRDDAIKFAPEGWINTFEHWMENIRDWCVSRQLWWGHQIPAWYCGDCKKITVSRTDAKECAHCKSKKLTQDEDVLDTWFSSGLWPFSTLGWPAKTKALETFYPSTVMETGFDILFFWVARMIMMGQHFNDGKVPFKRVYLHAMVRDEKGQKMSKTKGNVIDPLDIIRDYGADAFRFTLAIMAGQGRDVKLALDRIEGYKAFCNKLWNASRYTLMRLGYVTMEGLEPAPRVDFDKVLAGQTLEQYLTKNHAKLHPINRWILSRLNEATEKVEAGFENFRLNESAAETYQFIWNELCDWYIEFSKELLTGEHAEQTQVTLLYTLTQGLKLSHPLIPFVTEEIFHSLPKTKGEDKTLIVAKYPAFNKAFADEEAVATVEIWKTAVEKLRAFRGENGIAPKARPEITFEASDPKWSKAIELGAPVVRSIAQLGALTREAGKLKGAATTAEILTPHATFFVSLVGLVDVDAELKRLEKERAQTEKDIEFVRSKLSKDTFIAKAPKELVEAEQAKLKGFENKLQELAKSAQKLAGLRK